MIVQNKYTKETIHVANWYLLSRRIDVDALIATARRTEEMACGGEEWDMDTVLARLLENEFFNALRLIVPNAWNFDQMQTGYAMAAKAYRNGDRSTLVLPPMAEFIGRLNFKHVSALILEHVYASRHAAAAKVAA